ncbi:MAG: hypothetical protein K8S87_05990 [Planctomycetes bacterium]|nr:hypothetical protein [Planctomycetota bacterium]
MKIFSFLLLILIVIGSSCAAFESNDCLEYDFDYGMNNFKFDNEWIIEKEGQSIIRIGINVKSFNSKMPKEIEAFDKKVKPVDTSIINLESANKSSRKDQIVVFYLPIENNILKLKLEVTTKLTKGYGKYAGIILTEFNLEQNVYFYNPKKEQWFGFTEAYNHVNESDHIVGESYFSEKSLGQIFKMFLYREPDWDSPVLLMHRERIEDYVEMHSSKIYDSHLALIDSWLEKSEKSTLSHPLLWWKDINAPKKETKTNN